MVFASSRSPHRNPNPAPCLLMMFITAAGWAGERPEPLRAGRLPYRCVSSGASDLEIVRVWRDAEDKQFPWRRKMPGGRIEHLKIDASGGVSVGAVEEPAHNARTVYRPALPISAPGLKIGRPSRFEGRVTVYRLDRPQQVRDRGTYAAVLERDADRALSVRSRPIRCRTIRSMLEIELGMATVRARTTDWVTPSGLMVAEESTETVKALLPLWTTHQRMKLAAIPSAELALLSQKP